MILGGGFGGLTAAKRLRRARMDIVLLDRTNHHLFQPLLYQVASAALSPGDIASPIREVLRRQENATVIMAEVTRIDKEKKVVELATGEPISYDYLIVATGARHDYFGHAEWEQHAPGIKTLRDALRIRENILLSFEKAERCTDPSIAERYLSFVVIGGGPTGVELAGAIAEIAHRTMLRDFRRIDPSRTQVYLVEAASQILPTFGEELGRKAQHQLEKLRVNVLVNSKVTEVTSRGVQLEGRFIEAETVLWAAGNQASPLLKTLDVQLDRQGRVLVEPDLSIAGHPNLFVIGDAARFDVKDGSALPAIATVAIQQAKYVSAVIRKGVPEGERRPFNFFDAGMMATIGKAKAVAMIGRLRLSGFLAWLLWGWVHIFYLIGFRNRVSVMLGWIFWYFYEQRAARLIHRTLDANEDV